MSAFRDKKTRSQTKESERWGGYRDVRQVKDEHPKICFSFKEVDLIQCPPGQTFEDWQKDGLLAGMLKRFVEVCDRNVIEAQQSKILNIYGEFPPKSKFKGPANIPDDVKWAVIRNVNGQKGRVAGYIVGNVFHVVFLDKDHKFYEMKDK